MIEVELRTWDNGKKLTTQWIDETRELLVYKTGKQIMYFRRDIADEERGQKPRYLEVKDVLVISASPQPHVPLDQKAEVSGVINRFEKQHKGAT